MIEWIHPGLILIIGAALVPFLRGKGQQGYLIALTVTALADCVLMTPGTYGTANFLGQTLVFGRVDRLSLVFSYVFTLMAVIGIIYSLHVKDTVQHVAALVYMGGALGVTFAGDFLTLFIFWEFMAFASVLLVWSSRNRQAVAAGFRYLLVHIFGGVCLLGGILLHFSQTGSLAFTPLMPFQGNLSFALILTGFILNAAVPPLGAWLPDAYPEATVTGAVFMTAFTTKSAVYVLIRGFAGTEILVWLGAIMALYGVVYAVLENDARRLLAYHIISQVGYMVCGVGIGTEMALNGSSAHAFAHILYKGLLFMGAGAVMYMTGKRNLSEMGGLYKTMPVTMVLYMIGGFAISAVPLFSGFVSKSMVVSAAGESHRAAILLMLTMASAGTFLHTGLKLPYYMFFAKDCGIRTKEPPANMLAAMGIAAFFCIFIGVFPKALYALLPYHVEYVPYTAQHVFSTLGILAFTALGFFMLLKHLDPEPTISMDTDWFYRKGARVFMWIVNRPVAWFEYKVVGEAYDFIIRNFIIRVGQLCNRADARIDRAAEGIGTTAVAVGQEIRKTQTGRVHDYAFAMAAGVFAVIVLIVLW